MKDLIEYLVKCLVDRPDEVTVVSAEPSGENGGRMVVLEVSVAEADIGKVIGRQGRVVNSLRAIASAAGVRDGRRAVVRVVD